MHLCSDRGWGHAGAADNAWQHTAEAVTEAASVVQDCGVSTAIATVTPSWHHMLQSMPVPAACRAVNASCAWQLCTPSQEDRAICLHCSSVLPLQEDGAICLHCSMPKSEAVLMTCAGGASASASLPSHL